MDRDQPHCIDASLAALNQETRSGVLDHFKKSDAFQQPHRHWPTRKRPRDLLLEPFGLMLAACFDRTELHGDTRKFDQADPAATLAATLAQPGFGRTGAWEFR